MYLETFILHIILYLNAISNSFALLPADIFIPIPLAGLKWYQIRTEDCTMKLVDSSMVAKAEGIFFSAMSSVLDIAIILELFRKHCNFQPSGEVKFQDLDVVVHNNKIAFQFEYTAHVYFSIYMDRSGSFVPIEENADHPKVEVARSDVNDSLVAAELIRKKESQLAETIADAIERETLARLIQLKNHATLKGQLDFMGARFAVHQARVVYNLIYQGEIAMSFLLDEKGKFLDFAEAKKVSNDAKNESKQFEASDCSELDDLTIEEELDSIEGIELNEDSDLPVIDDEELKGLEQMVIDELMNVPEEKNATN